MIIFLTITFAVTLQGSSKGKSLKGVSKKSIFASPDTIKGKVSTKTHCLDIKIQDIKGTKFSSSIEKSILGCFHPLQNPTGTWILGMILR